jgi:outer membrane receptor protein involved in Fe transport
VWASVSGARSDGRTVTLDVNDGMGGTQPTTVNNVDAFYATTASGRAWWGPFTAQWFYTTRDQIAPQGAYGTRLLDTRTHLTDSRGMAEIRFEPHLTSSVQLLTRAFGNFYDYYADYAYEPPPSPPNLATSREAYHGNWFGGEARLVATPFNGVRLSAGGEIQVHPGITLCGERGGTITPGVNCGEGGANARPQYLNVNQSLTIGAIYLLVEARVNNWFRFSAGARGDIYSTFGASGNPRIALIFRPTPNGVLKVLAGRAFRAPSIYELTYNDNGQTQIAAPMLRPETIYSGEIEYSHHFLEDWTALAAIHSSFVQDIIETAGSGTRDDPLQYANSLVPVVTAGADLEVRREWRQGWMVSANYGYQFAQYTQQPSDSCSETLAPDTRSNALRVVNAPEHHASLRAVVPIVQGLASGALRMTLESPRRVSASDCSLTQPAVIADAVISGGVQRYGLRYAIGVYNLFDWRYALPVGAGWSSNTITQNGRNFMLNVQYTF